MPSQLRADEIGPANIPPNLRLLAWIGNNSTVYFVRYLSANGIHRIAQIGRKRGRTFKSSMARPSRHNV